MATSEKENISIIRERKNKATKNNMARQEVKRPAKNQNWVDQCTYSSNSHNRNNCPAYHKNCKSCGKKRHFAKMHRTKQKRLYKVRRSSSTENSDHEEDEMNTILKKNIYASRTEKWKIKLKVNETSIDFKIDTGAEVNVLPVKIYNNIKPKPKLNKTSVRLTAYNNTKIPVTGSCTVTLQSKNAKKNKKTRTLL